MCLNLNGYSNINEFNSGIPISTPKIIYINVPSI